MSDWWSLFDGTFGSSPNGLMACLGEYYACKNLMCFAPSKACVRIVFWASPRNSISPLPRLPPRLV